MEMFKHAQSTENGIMHSQGPITWLQQSSTRYQTYFIYSPIYFTPLKHIFQSKALTLISFLP